ncbi:MAG: hypothetical protein COX20_04810 [Desulfobacterales bacterium CG23_combo_of_CG06-09_8_20_14_all_52_9]|nr:MAG: hypothetical protein COX20_04810 [Desulfobacterales bacterium CG23_combo_of_CG06-09_8_20_14_all_52_9]
MIRLQGVSPQGFENSLFPGIEAVAGCGAQNGIKVRMSVDKIDIIFYEKNEIPSPHSNRFMGYRPVRLTQKEASDARNRLQRPGGSATKSLQGEP